jgi:23S rRNA pseudouridine1911/1915/1917 synthase
VNAAPESKAPSEPPGVPTPLDVIVPAAVAGGRVDRVVSLLSGLPRRVVADLVRAGGVRLDGLPVTMRSRAVQEGQRLQVDVQLEVDDVPRPDPTVAFSVVYQDSQLIVIDKPAGLVVHHGAGNRTGTLVDGLLARFPELAHLAEAGGGDPHRPGIVHRLDKGTSGLLVVARTPDAYRSLARQFRTHSAARAYTVLVADIVEADAGTIDAPIGRSSRQRTRMAVTARGKQARTEYRVVSRFHDPVPCTLLEATLETGRTHQVRVHLAAIGHPVIGDERYGGPTARPPAVMAKMAPGRLFLHAFRLTLDHPDNGPMTFDAPLPQDLTMVIETLSP